ncbi:MAG: patatin-like phospholipase family protein [Planctomycetia bacterium]|nr:MAG: patatin-like phospholipase family protein [Planctomycetia bacterium]
MNQKFRVLSLSGGGVRGLYTASFLAEIEHLSGKKFADHFDLIVGTSTGGLIAIAIGLGNSVASIRDFYKNNGATIFPAGIVPRFFKRFRRIAYPIHDNAVLERLIKQCVGEERTIGDSKRPLVINAFHAAGGKPVCFKTRHHDDFKKDHSRKAWEVAMATSAAPVFYRAFQAEDGTDWIDGGVWANCPVLVGAIEAIDRFGKPRDQIDILSIGTTKTPFSIDHGARCGGAWRNVSMKNRAVVNLLMEANRRSAMFMAQRLIGPDSILEIDRDVDKGGYEMDDASPNALRDLQALGEDDAKTHVQSLVARYFQAPAAPWSPMV